MKRTVTILLCILTFSLSQAQTSDNEGVKKACMNYLEGFYEGDTAKLTASLQPSLNKFGFWKDDNTDSYRQVNHMSFEAALAFAKNVKEKKEFPAADAPKKVEILDISNTIASAKLFNGSTNNTFNHVTIKNSTVGILSEGNQDDASKLNIMNSQIYNSSNFGILGRATSINAENLVINNSGQSSFAGTFGGRYNVVHSTLANYWNNSFRQFPSVLLNNYIVDEDNVTFTNPLEEANFINTIIYGNDNPEMLLDKDDDDIFNFKFTNCLIRFVDSNNNFTGDEYDFDNIALYENIIFNEDPEFLDPFSNKLQIPIGSPSDGFGIMAGNLFSDIIGTMRSTPSDLGAYESIEFEEED